MEENYGFRWRFFCDFAQAIFRKIYQKKPRKKSRLSHPNALVAHLAAKSYQKLTEQELIDQLKRGDRAAQRGLYDRYSKLMFWVARKYLSKKEDAEEALLNGFFKAMTQIERFEGRGSFEGWIRRIVINESLMMLRSRETIHFPIEEARLEGREDDFNVEADLSARDILSLLERLPTGCRTVFSLYAIDGLKHHEIAEVLGISINTSKSQLLVAREKLQAMVKKQFNF